MTDPIIRNLTLQMGISRSLGAPLDGIPAKACEVIELIMPYLAKNTTPREAALVMATVYLYIASLLTRVGGTMEYAKELLDVTHYLLANVIGKHDEHEED